MLGIFARSLFTATRFTPHGTEKRHHPGPRIWDAPRHWTEVDARLTHEARRR